MIKPKDPRELAEAILTRSTCSVQVGAVLADKHGIFAWGWNSMGPDGYGLHAERHCLRRANKDRAMYGTLYVASRRLRNGRSVNSRPCDECEGMLLWADIQPPRIWYRNGDSQWVRMAAE